MNKATYSLPEQFLDDPSVPAHWKLYGLINGFWINGLPVYASNAFFAEKLKCSERHISGSLEILENIGLLTRNVQGYKRLILQGGMNPEFRGGRTGSSGEGELGVQPNASSIASNNTSESDDSQESSEESEDQYSPTDSDHKIEYTDDDGNPLTPVRKKKYPHSKDVFSWFPRPEPSWKLNTTELTHAEMLWERGEVEVKKRLKYVENHKDEDFLPSITKPSDLERKWNDLALYAKRNR